MLKVENTILLMIDVQEKLLRVMHDKESLLLNLQKLIRGCVVLGVPTIVTEQNPSGLGPTVSELASLLPVTEKVIKFSFSCCSDTGFTARFQEVNRRQVLVCGIESHICVYQTAMDLLTAGYEVQVVSDGVASRAAQNKALALQRLAAEGAKITGVEMALFELLRTAKAQQFKAISGLVKD